jgi:hypothetical protein
VLVLFMLEEVVDAFVFEQALDEVEVGLAVLHRVLAFAVAGLEPGLDVGETALGQYLGGQHGGIELEEDAAVARVVEERQLRVQDGHVAGVLHGQSGLGEVGDDAVEETGVAGI